MENLKELKLGWDFMADLLGADIASNIAFNEYSNNVFQNQQIDLKNLHLQEINAAIEELEKRINEHPNLNLNVEQFKGFVAEEFHAGTFNIEAIRQGSKHRAFTLQENGYASVDIDTNFGKQYSSKYANLAKDAENYQAVLDKTLNAPKYKNMERLIASEQIDEAKYWADRRYAKDINNRPDVAASHLDTKEHLTGNITDDDGIKSMDLSIKESKQIAGEAKNGGFKTEEHGISKEQYLDSVKIDYLNNALKAGLTAATITAITQLVPEIYKVIDYLIKNGEIDVNQLKKSGLKVLSSSGEAFLRGSIAFGIQMAISQGLFGETLKSIDPTGIGVIVTVIIGTVKNGILVAKGKMTSAEMGMHFIDTLVTTAGYVVGAKIGGAIAQTLLPDLPFIGYAIGSLLGCAVSVVYNIGKKKLISFCVDTGFTCFGLVEQDYELPESVLQELGIKTVNINKTEIKKVQINKNNVETRIKTTPYETIDITSVRRGIIGVNKVGYIL